MLIQGTQDGAVAIPVRVAARAWRVIHTKSRQEKALAEVLEARGIEHYLPLIRKVRYYGRRKHAVQLPLFPGYVFLKGEMDEAYIADRTDRVARVIDVADQAALEADLHAIRFALDRNGGLEPAPIPEVGAWVEVSAGPFRGLRGIVDRTVQDDRLVLGVRVLGRAADLEIDRTLLRPIE